MDNFEKWWNSLEDNSSSHGKYLGPPEELTIVQKANSIDYARWIWMTSYNQNVE